METDVVASTADSAKKDSASAEVVSAADKTAKLLPKGPIVLFDGVCNFCNGAIQFLVDHERATDLQFAPLQSELATELLDETFGVERSKLLREGTTGTGDPDTIIFLEDSGTDHQRRGYTHSAAGLRIAHHLRAPWRWAFIFVIIPRPIRDFLYRVIAKNRYRWFGKSETCRIPTPELRKRFLAQAK